MNELNKIHGIVVGFVLFFFLGGGGYVGVDFFRVFFSLLLSFEKIMFNVLSNFLFSVMYLLYNLFICMLESGNLLPGGGRDIGVCRRRRVFRYIFGIFICKFKKLEFSM